MKERYSTKYDSPEYVELVASLLESSGVPKFAAIAAWVRRNQRTSPRICALAAPYVKTCGLCEKRALYRYGLEGRCSAHKMILTSGKKHQVEKLNARSGTITSELDAKDKAEKARLAVKRLGDYAGLVLEGGSR